MKRRLMIALIVLVLAALACNAPAAGEDQAGQNEQAEALPAGETTVATNTPAPGGEAEQPAGDTANAGDTGSQPTPAPTEAPKYTDYATFEKDLMDAIIYREYEKMQGMMGSTFSIANWRSEPTDLTPADAIRLLQTKWLPATGDVYYELGEDLSTILGGYSPQAYWPGANIVSHARFTTGWGPDGNAEAVVFINKDDQGVYTWYSVALTRGGFEAMRNIGPNGGFLVGAIDAATLPNLRVVGGGLGPATCEETPDHPAIRLITISGLQHHQLCLYNFSGAVGSPDITLELTSPQGVTFKDTYSFAQADYGIEMVSAMGGNSGLVQDEDMYGTPGLPTVPVVPILAAANVPAGPWVVNVNTADGSASVENATVTLAFDGPFVQPVQDLIHNPLTSIQFRYTAGEVPLIAGTGYPANTEVTVAVYYNDPNIEVDANNGPYAVPRYAAKVITDSTGSFLLEFVVGKDMTPGSYQVTASTDFASMQWLDPIYGYMTIE